MTEEQIIREFWMIYFHNVRNSPSEGADNETVYEASEAFETEFDEYMRSEGLTKDANGRWVEVES